MNEERWLKTYLKEELRGIMNINPSKWGREFDKEMRKVGDWETIKLKNQIFQAL